jgi:Primase X
MGYRTWLVAEKINDKLEEKNSWKHRGAKNFGYNKTDTIPWIEKLLQTPIADHRKYALWRIVIPYLFNVRKLADSDVVSTVQTWLNGCTAVRPLDFNSKYVIRQYIRNRKKDHYFPISINKLSSENQELFSIISEKWIQ